MKRLYKAKGNEQEHNGWTNYKTYIVNLEFTNTADLYFKARTLVQQGISVYDLAKWIKNNHRSEYLNGVNYDEIAQAFIEDEKEQ